MGFYFQDCVKSVYKANFRPSQVACPHTYTYVPLTDQVKKMIDSEKKPRLVPQNAPNSFPIPSIEQAKVGGEKVVLHFENGNKLEYDVLNEKA